MVASMEMAWWRGQTHHRMAALKSGEWIEKQMMMKKRRD
jgi:hypothetical protein